MKKIISALVLGLFAVTFNAYAEDAVTPSEPAATETADAPAPVKKAKKSKKAKKEHKAAEKAGDATDSSGKKLPPLIDPAIANDSSAE